MFVTRRTFNKASQFRCRCYRWYSGCFCRLSHILFIFNDDALLPVPRHHHLHHYILSKAVLRKFFTRGTSNLSDTWQRSTAQNTATRRPVTEIYMPINTYLSKCKYLPWKSAGMWRKHCRRWIKSSMMDQRVCVYVLPNCNVRICNL
jgi:hypothetical protein